MIPTMLPTDPPPHDMTIDLTHCGKLWRSFAKFCALGHTIWVHHRAHTIARFAPLPALIPDTAHRIGVDDLGRHFSVVFEPLARQQPIVVTVHRRPAFVLVPAAWSL